MTKKKLKKIVRCKHWPEQHFLIIHKQHKINKYFFKDNIFSQKLISITAFFTMYPQEIKDRLHIHQQHKMKM